MKMESKTFTFQFHQKLIPGFLAAAKYDGVNSSLTAVTSLDKVLIYHPKNKKGKQFHGFDDNEISVMNINQSVKSISAGCLDQNGDNDVLMIGTTSFLYALDVHNNVDVFFKEVKDGVNSITVGKFGEKKNPVVFIGGNCCVQAFDEVGNQVFWNVVGDRVSSMALVDIDRDGLNELVVGSTDYEITAFKNEHIVSEVTETEVITSLVSVDNVTFAYALSNGTIGLYDQLQRWWRVKSKNQAISLLGYDIDGDGVEELITGWSNGKVDARNSRTGDIVFTENMKHGVAGLAKADMVQVGRYDLVTCSVNGEVIGYKACKRGGYLRKWQPGVEEETIQDMMLKKQDLMYEMKNYEGNAKYASQTENTSKGISRDSRNEEYGVIPVKIYALLETWLLYTLLFNINIAEVVQHSRN